MLLYWLQQTGHRPIALIGGGTTRVGVPSGKDQSPRPLTDEAINDNLKGIRAIFSKVLKFDDAGGNAVMANNADWLKTLNYIDIPPRRRPPSSINRMLAFHSVRLRLDRQQEISSLEFNYMILQAYDFVDFIAVTAASCRWAAPTNGATSSTASISAASAQRTTFRADLAAHHHLVRRQDGQDRCRRGVARSNNDQPKRFLAILAKRRGCGRSALSEAIYNSAAE